MATQVTLDSAKFEKLFTSIERQLIMQSSFLESMYNIQTYQLELDKEREETRRREFELLRMRPQENSGPNAQDETESDSTEDSAGKKNSLSSIIGKLIGFGLAGAELFSFRNILGVGLAVALAGPIQDFLSGLIGASLENAGADSAFALSFGDALGQAGAWAAIGSVFGKKAALWFGVAGATSSIFTDTVNRVFDTNQDGIADAFGAEFSPEVVTGIGTAMGIGAAGVLRYGPLQSKLLMGVSALLGAYGDDAAKWLEDQTGIPADFSEGAIDALSGAAYGASLGFMFGPTGALIGAIAGLAISGGASLIGWLNARSEADLKAAKEKAEKDLKAIEDQLASGQMDLAGASLKSASESIAELNMLDSDAAAEMNERLKGLQTKYTQSGGTDESVAEAVSTAGMFVDLEQQARNPDAARQDPKALADAKARIDDYVNYQYKEPDPNAAFDVALADVQTSVALPNLSPEYRDQAMAYMESKLKQNLGLLTPSTTPAIIPNLSATEQRIIAAANKMKQSEIPSGGGASTVVAGNNSGNVNRGGDSITNNTTNIYGNPASKSLDEGNSVPKLQYGVQ